MVTLDEISWPKEQNVGWSCGQVLNLDMIIVLFSVSELTVYVLIIIIMIITAISPLSEVCQTSNTEREKGTAFCSKCAILCSKTKLRKSMWNVHCLVFCKTDTTHWILWTLLDCIIGLLYLYRTALFCSDCLHKTPSTTPLSWRWGLSRDIAAHLSTSLEKHVNGNNSVYTDQKLPIYMSEHFGNLLPIKAFHDFFFLYKHQCLLSLS